MELRRGSAVSQRRASRPVTMHMSRKAVEIDASSEGSGTDYSDDEVLMLKKDDGFRPVKGQPGMYYKVGDSLLFLYSGSEQLSGILVSVKVILDWTMRFGKSSVLRRKFCYNKLCFSVDPLMT